MRTKVFKSGNSQAVRIPAEMAFEPGTEVEIARNGDMITIRPARRRNLKDVLAYLRATPPPAPLGPIERTLVRLTAWDIEDAEREKELAEDAHPFEGPAKPDG